MVEDDIMYEVSYMYNGRLSCIGRTAVCCWTRPVSDS